MLIELIKAYTLAWFGNEARGDLAAALISVLFHPFKQMDRLLKRRPNHFLVAGGFYYLGRKP